MALKPATSADRFFADDQDEAFEIPADVPRHGGDDRPWIRFPGVEHDPSDDHSSTRKRGRGTFYSRASSVGKPIEDWFQVHEAQLDRLVFGMGRRPELAAQAQLIQAWETDRDKIRAIRKEAITAGGGLEAAIRGTVFHELAEQRFSWRLGGYDHMHLADDMAQGLDVLARLLEPFEVLDTETFVVWDEHRIAGSYDMRLRLRRPIRIERVAKDGTVTLLAELEPGEVIVADLKSGKDRKYHGPTYGVQQLPYACGTPYTHREGRKPWSAGEAPRTDWALIPHVSPLDPETAGLYWVDLKAARKRLALVEQIREARKVDDLFIPHVETEQVGEPVQLREVLPDVVHELGRLAHAAVLEAIELAADQAVLDELWVKHGHEWRDEWTAAVQAKLAQLSNGATEVRTS
jgi:hypothetical protein